MVHWDTMEQWVFVAARDVMVEKKADWVDLGLGCEAAASEA